MREPAPVSPPLSITQQLRTGAGSVLDYVRTDIPVFHEGTTVGEALHSIRVETPDNRIVYYYVIDAQRKLMGVLPVRRLLSADPEAKVSSVMIENVVSLTHGATLSAAFELFDRHKYLALPVVDDEGRYVGILDVTALTGSAIDTTQRNQIDEVFETIGLKLSAVLAESSPFASFRSRFPWLAPTLISGLSCALIAGLYEKTLAESLVIAFFLTLVLGIGESVSMQSLTITIRRLRTDRLSWRWYFRLAWRETLTALLLGSAVGAAVGAVAFTWQRSWAAAVWISLSILLSVLSACLSGITAPTLIRGLKLDPKVAAGPLALAVADLCTLVFYFTLAQRIL